jgi:predicted dehydrogenase
MGERKEKGRDLSRRAFIQKTGSGTVGLGLWMASGPWIQAAVAEEPVRIGMLGFGVRGRQLAMAVERVGGMEVAAVCDVYDGRFRRAQEVLESKNVEMAKDYLQVLNRSDIDAVVVATPDHWHQKMTVEALEAGKDVYLEKPLAHTIEEGKEIVAAVERTGQMLEVGSQLMSSTHLHEAKELIKAGRLGEVTQVKARWDTGNVIGAWAGDH